ncbi:hypothetical protein LKL48_15565, partial [Listeria monocytogenes]
MCIRDRAGTGGCGRSAGRFRVRRRQELRPLRAVLRTVRPQPAGRVLLPVSYTHLTLPTILRVYVSVVAVSLTKKKKTYT